MTGGQVHSQITLAVHVRYVLGEETHWVPPAVGKLRRNTHLSDEAGRWEPTMQTNEAAAYHEGSVLQGFGGGGATVVVELTQRQGVFTAVPVCCPNPQQQNTERRSSFSSSWILTPCQTTEGHLRTGT